VSKTPSKSPAYIGIGGWTFAPWRGVFYPEKLVQAWLADDELRN
jgi:uncharacterized protein YecE (DUF72 family)